MEGWILVKIDGGVLALIKYNHYQQNISATARYTNGGAWGLSRVHIIASYAATKVVYQNKHNQNVLS